MGVGPIRLHRKQAQQKRAAAKTRAEIEAAAAEQAPTREADKAQSAQQDQRRKH
ncbi:MAG: hypothetical protein WC683_17840 [bacterium]